MPLDGHSYLVGQGWTGTGTGLRQGAISRPLAIPQKKTLAGLGKDRDDAFPFWDHLFAAASKSIQIKISNDSSDTESISLKRTTTGILSNRRPATGLTAESTDTPHTPRLSLLATAKRDAAKQMLYAQFFRGPVIAPDSPSPSPAPVPELSPEKKRRKLADGEDKAARRERKRLRREKRELKRLKREKRELKRAEKEKAKAKGKESESPNPVVANEEGSSSEPVAKGEKRKRRPEDTYAEAKERPRRKRKASESNIPG